MDVLKQDRTVVRTEMALRKQIDEKLFQDTHQLARGTTPTWSINPGTTEPSATRPMSCASLWVRPSNRKRHGIGIGPCFVY